MSLGLSGQTNAGGAGGHGGNGSGGGNRSGGGSGDGPATIPVIVAQPVSRTVTEGAGVTFAVEVTGKFPVYQWFKNGGRIAGAESPVLTLEKTTSADAGTYTVSISNFDGTVASAAAVLTVTPAVRAEAPSIVLQPVAQSVAAGSSATFSVVAAGTGPLSYQWQMDGIAIAGATSATLAVANASASAVYRVLVANPVGSVLSGPALLSVNVPIDGVYVGRLGENGDSFALLVRADRTGVFLGFDRVARTALVGRDLVVSANQTFVATLEGGNRIEGAIASDGTLSGAIPGLTLTFSAPAAIRRGDTAAVAGFYPTRAVGRSEQGFALVSAAGQVVVVNVDGAGADGGAGTVSADGAIAVTTVGNARVVGTVSAATAIYSTTVTAATGVGLTFVGANEARPGVARLGNISTRSQIGPEANAVIAGFVIAGTQPGTVLIRAVGPTLAAFGVGGALSAARLEVFRGETSLAVGNDWGTPAADGASAAAIAAAAVRAGAFPLANNSRDAALLLDLAPGAYTAVVTGQGGAGGIGLAEVYDATDGAIPGAPRIINTATRAFAGTGEGALITGFVITGTVPKRVLIRGVGPALASFGVAGALARPSLTVSSGATVLATNAGWSTSPDAAAIAGGAARVGAFPFAAGAPDAAVVINLAPGAYTAQVAGVGNTTGVALVELYELP